MKRMRQQEGRSTFRRVNGWFRLRSRYRKTHCGWLVRWRLRIHVLYINASLSHG